eukprot:CAMPEP_0206488226 /NCGR_PEP_ID=MMETSP0324_2-20121206/42252_1 /ASSEMBLY_ACC=CAM_ASM_000836 /TAXON_ID=2866 /ORGANISM="Crypthecodinium cohnii, Strain Seligo" /LENGTH=241 /DNA_ID=CAMNT_0053967141 /DNA_START=202 /DNA_END=927 /DNA_ORIENTATION=+
MGQACCCTGDETKNVKTITAVDDEKTPGYSPDNMEVMADTLQEANKSKSKPVPEGKKSDGTDGAINFTLVRDSKVNIGLNLDALDGVTAFVDDVVPGAVESWNSSHPPHERLQVYDRILTVNNIKTDTDSMLAELKVATNWKLCVIRPTEVQVSVDCTMHPSLGLDLKYSPNGNTLLISELGEGAIKEWNKNSTMQITRFDRIVGINGVRGGARSLLQTAADCESLQLAILHYEGGNIHKP